MRDHRGWLWQSVWYTGAFGMNLFFVLSSYLITTLLMKERERSGSVNVAFFYTRRVLRIWPLYLVFLLALWGGGHLFNPWTVTTGTLVSFLLMFGNWYLIYANVPGPVMPLWSISLEEQFYLLWPGLFTVTSIPVFTVISALLIPISLAGIWWLRSLGTPFWQIWWNTLPQMQFFGIGALIALCRFPVIIGRRVPARLLAVAGALLCWIAGGFMNYASDRGIHTALMLVSSYGLSAIGCLLLFRAFLGIENMPRFWLYLGRISYGLYVFHQVSLDTARFLLDRFYGSHPLMLAVPIGFAITLALASISYPLLEKPFLRFKKRFEIVHSRSN